VEGKVSDVRNALKTEKADVVQARATELADLLAKVGTAAYAAAGTPSDGGSSGPAGDAAGEPGATPNAEDETVEGEFKEV
jgi:hypothetical protein